MSPTCEMAEREIWMNQLLVVLMAVVLARTEVPRCDKEKSV